jgi:hypothetical protein
MCLFSVFMCFSDVILKNPAVQMLLLGQNIRSDPRYVLPMVKLRLTPDDLPLLPSDQRYAIGTVERFGWDSEWAVHFLVAQLIMLLAVAALVWGMRRAQLVSRNTALALAGLYLASWVTRLV